MADIVAYNIFDEQSGNKNTDNRINEIEIVDADRTETAGEQMLNRGNKPFQYQRRGSREDSDQKTDYQDEMFLLDMFLTPQQKSIK